METMIPEVGTDIAQIMVLNYERLFQYLDRAESFQMINIIGLGAVAGFIITLLVVMFFHAR